RMRGSHYARTDYIAIPLYNLAGVLIERGDVAQSLALAKEAVPILLNAGRVWTVYDALSLRAVKIGRYADAARLHGRSIAAYASVRITERESNERRMYDCVASVLREKLADTELGNLLAEGAKLSDEDACELALVK